jgi:hypothetical protein
LLTGEVFTQTQYFVAYEQLTIFHVVELLCASRVPHVLALIFIGFAGCSANMSTRLSQVSFSNPFASQPEASVPAPAERREVPRYPRPQSLAHSSALRTNRRNLIRPRAPVSLEGTTG